MLTIHLMIFCFDLSGSSQPSEVMLIRSDGLDQAKHRCPRTMLPSKIFSELVRPALHCHMLWSHAWTCNFWMADPDMHKNTCVHVDLLARMFSKCFDEVKMLPKHCALVLDNTASNNKNAYMLRLGNIFAILCFLLNLR